MDVNDEENIEWLMESSKTVENSGGDFEVTDNDDSELYHFLQILRSAFESEPLILESKAKGVVNTDEDLQKLLKRLKALGYFFSIRSSENKKSSVQNCKLMIANKKSNSSSHPYRVISHIHYSCSHRNRQRHEDREKDNRKNIKRYTNCKAMLDIRQVEIFTNVCLTSVRRKRIKELKKFRRSLATNTTEPGVTKYSVVISLPKAHNHFRDVKGQYLSDEVKAAMHSLVQSGVTSLPDIQEKLYQIVDEDFSRDSIKPSRDNSAFYPNQKTIYNHLRHDGLSLKRIYKRNSSDIGHLKKKCLDELGYVYSEVKKCTDNERLIKICNILENIRK